MRDDKVLDFMKKKTLLFLACAVCLAAITAVYIARTTAARTADHALAVLFDDYCKVQEIAYTGFVDLDSETEVVIQGTHYFRIEDEEIKTMEDFEALLRRVYTQRKAAEVLAYCVETTGILTEMEGRLYRADAYEIGWPIGPEVGSARKDGDTITVQVTLEWSESVPGILTLKQEDGDWKIDELEQVA